MKEKILAVLEDEEIEVLYKILLEYFWDNDPGKEEEYRILEPLYDKLLAAMKKMYPERFKKLDWDDIPEPITDDDLPF